MTEPGDRGVYREMPDVLGLSERDAEATRAFGEWRDRTRTVVLVAFAIAGVLLGAVAYYHVQEWQLANNRGRALLIINIAGASVPLFLLLLLGKSVGRRVVLSRTPAKLAELASAYEIPVERLAETANLVKRL